MRFAARPPPVGVSAPGSAPPFDGEAQRRVRLCGTALGVLGSCSLLGIAFSPYLVTHWPLRVVAVMGIAEWMREYVEIALGWIDWFWIPATAVTASGVVLYQIWNRRTRTTS